MVLPNVSFPKAADDRSCEMISPSESARGVDTIDLQQEIVRLQALLETSRQVHSTIRQDEVLSTVLRIVVRELELSGALITDPPMTYGEVPCSPWEGCFRFPLHETKKAAT